MQQLPQKAIGEKKLSQACADLRERGTRNGERQKRKEESGLGDEHSGRGRMTEIGIVFVLLFNPHCSWHHHPLHVVVSYELHEHAVGVQRDETHVEGPRNGEREAVDPLTAHVVQ